MADDRNVTWRECNLRHIPLDLYLEKIDKKFTSMNRALYTTLFLVIANLAIVLILRTAF